MKSPQKTGKAGEIKAQLYLTELGHSILHTNYKKGRGEIDIVSSKDDVLVFTEVKTRTYNNIYSAAEAIDDKKCDRIRNAAMHYLVEYKWSGECRFDVILIYASNLEHYENAF